MTDKTTQAQDVLRNNSIDDAFTVPTHNLYPFQWNWDSCFVALGWITFDENRAWKEIETLLKGQCPSGKIPHILFHQYSDSYFPGPLIWEYGNAVPSSGITQPPVLASAIRMAYEHCEDKESAKDFIISNIEKVLAYHRWYHTKRDPNQTGLVANFHPWETGRDNSAEWDAPLKNVPLDSLEPYTRKDLNHISAAYRPTDDDYDYYVSLLQQFKRCQYNQLKLYDECPFKVADVGVNSILARANNDLLFLLKTFDCDKKYIEEVESWHALQKNAFSQFYSEEDKRFYSIDLISGKHLKKNTSASYTPLWSKLIDSQSAQTLADTLSHEKIETDYLVPSLNKDDSNFDPHCYWRGPIWAIMNFMIGTGFKDYNHVETARLIQNQTLELINKNDFSEYYNPITGEGCGGNKFSWTAAIWLYWQQQNK